MYAPLSTIYCLFGATSSRGIHQGNETRGIGRCVNAFASSFRAALTTIHGEYRKLIIGVAHALVTDSNQYFSIFYAGLTDRERNGG